MRRLRHTAQPRLGLPVCTISIDVGAHWNTRIVRLFVINKSCHESLEYVLATPPDDGGVTVILTAVDVSWVPVV